jgi:hypothetical protein
MPASILHSTPPEHFRGEKETSIFPQEKRREKRHRINGNSLVRMDRREAS